MINYIAVLMALAAVSVSGSKAPTCDMTPDEHSAVTEIAIDDLKKKGYSVSEGTFEKVESNLLGSNKLAPYVMYQGFDILSASVPDPMFDGLPTFLPRPGSAVLNIGCTPFGVSYFSYRSYLLFNGNFSFVFASLGDSLNNEVIKTTGDDGIVQGRTAAVITTGYASTLSDITTALAIAGLGNATNLDGYNPAMIERPQMQPLVMLHRAHIWENADEKEAYLAQKRKIYLIEPQRMKPKYMSPLEEKFPVAARRNGTGRQGMLAKGMLVGESSVLPPIPERRKGTGVDERSLVPDFENMRTTLISGIKQKLSLTFTNSTELHNFPLNATKCIIEGHDCYGDNSDSYYLVGPPREDKMGSSNTYVVFGTNCVKTGKCTYNSLGFLKLENNRDTLKSLPAVVDYRQFPGSAKWFAPSLPDDVADMFFAYVVARSCFLIPFCVEIPYADLSYDDLWHPVFRIVLEPETATGAKLSELVMPTLMRFIPKSGGLKGGKVNWGTLN